MVSDEQLKLWRALGLKSVTTADGEVFEFFPRSALDLAADLTDDVSDPREAETEPPPVSDAAKIPPAIARIMTRGSVS
jgi:hypothetical protein